NMTSPDPQYGNEASGGSHYYPDRPDATRQYSAYDHRAGRDDEAARAEAQRRARRDAAERDRKQFIAARGASTVVQVVCYLFAVVLAIHVFLVIGEANPGNGFYQFIDSWRGGITLGLGDLFLPENYKFRIALNEGLAALVWIIIGIVLNTLIRRLLTPAPRNAREW